MFVLLSERHNLMPYVYNAGDNTIDILYDVFKNYVFFLSISFKIISIFL